MRSHWDRDLVHTDKEKEKNLYQAGSIPVSFQRLVYVTSHRTMAICHFGYVAAFVLVPCAECLTNKPHLSPEEPRAHTPRLSNPCSSGGAREWRFATACAWICVCMHMRGVKLDPAAESRAGNPTPRLQQKAFVTTSPPLLFNPPPSSAGIKELLHSQAGLLTIRAF